TRDADFLAPELYRDDDGRQWLDSKKGVTPIDMDGDADLDLVYLYNFGVHNGPAGIRFRQNDGTGKFGPPQNAGTVPGCGFSQLAAADFDQNGEDDLLCTS